MQRRALGCTSYLPWPLVTFWFYMYDYLPLLVLEYLHGVLQLLHACTTISGWSTSISLYVCKWKSHRPLAMLFSTNFGGVSHWELGTPCPYVAQMFLYTIPVTWLCLSAPMVHPTQALGRPLKFLLLFLFIICLQALLELLILGCHLPNVFFGCSMLFLNCGSDTH